MAILGFIGQSVVWSDVILETKQVSTSDSLLIYVLVGNAGLESVKINFRPERLKMLVFNDDYSKTRGSISNTARGALVDNRELLPGGGGVFKLNLFATKNTQGVTSVVIFDDTRHFSWILPVGKNGEIDFSVVLELSESIGVRPLLGRDYVVSSLIHVNSSMLGVKSQESFILHK